MREMLTATAHVVSNIVQQVSDMQTKIQVMSPTRDDYVKLTHALSELQAAVPPRTDEGRVTSKQQHKPLNRIRQLVECVSIDEDTGTLRG